MEHIRFDAGIFMPVVKVGGLPLISENFLYLKFGPNNVGTSRWRCPAV